MNYLSIESASTSNGLGFRVVLFTAGCAHQCKGCHNPQSWSVNAGKPFTKKEEDFIMSLLDKPYIKGLTLTGGDPLLPNSVPVITSLVERIKRELPSKDIWCYTGYLYEELKDNPFYKKVLSNIDVLIDGEFIQEKRDISLPFIGSSNQRVISLK